MFLEYQTLDKVQKSVNSGINKTVLHQRNISDGTPINLDGEIKT
jgi:hypothetical protein